MAEKKESVVKGHSFGASGFTLGVLSILGLSYIIFNMSMAITGFIFCFIQQRKKPTKLGKAGLILNVVGFLINLALIFLLPVISKYLPTGTFPTA
jgi:hypothetical protein